MNNQANFNWLSAAWRSQLTISEQRAHFGYVRSAFPLRKQAEASDYARNTDDPDYTFCREEYDNYVEIHDWVCRMLEYIEEGEEEYLALDIEERYGVEIRISKGMTTKQIAEAIYYEIKSNSQAEKRKILHWLMVVFPCEAGIPMPAEIGANDTIYWMVAHGNRYNYLISEIEREFGVELEFSRNLTFGELAEVIYNSMKEL